MHSITHLSTAVLASATERRRRHPRESWGPDFDAETGVGVVGQARRACKPTIGNGALLWERLYPNGYWGGGQGVDIGPGNTVYVAGRGYVNQGNLHQWTVMAYDRDGGVLPGFPFNYKHLSTAPYEYAYDVAVGDAGDFVVVGFVGSASGRYDWHVRAYAADLSLRWPDTYAGAADLSDVAREVAITPDGNYVVVGYTDVGMSLDESDLSHAQLIHLDHLTGEVLTSYRWDTAQSQGHASVAYRDRRLAFCGCEGNGTDNDARASAGDPPPCEIRGVGLPGGVGVVWKGAMEPGAIVHTADLLSPDWQATDASVLVRDGQIDIPAAAEGLFAVGE